jgi:hypothetical protein
VAFLRWIIRAMKFENDTLDASSSAFWVWLEQNSQQLANNVEDFQLVAALDRRVHLLHPHLSWEIGPGMKTDWHLAISPNLNKDLVDVARRIVAQAPTIPRWEFFPARQPKTWDGRLELGIKSGARVQLDASKWKYVLLRYPDGAHEIILHADNVDPLQEDDRWTAAAIVLESILGEETLMERVEKFELTGSIDAELAANEKPISLLKKAIASEG